MHTYLVFGFPFTGMTLLWMILFSYPLLIVATLGILFDERAQRIRPQYKLPKWGKAYFTVLFIAATLLVGGAYVNVRLFH